MAETGWGGGREIGGDDASFERRRIWRWGQRGLQAVQVRHSETRLGKNLMAIIVRSSASRRWRCCGEAGVCIRFTLCKERCLVKNSRKRFLF